MKNRSRFAVFLLVVVFDFAAVAFAQNPFAVGTVITPPEVLASVRVGEHGGCSGTIVAVGEEVAYGISAAHCGATVDQTFKIGFVDGSIGSARWRAINHEKDLALFVCWSADVLGHAPIPDGVPIDKPFAVGFPHTSGPKFSEFRYERSLTLNGNLPRSQFSLVSGEFGPGSSGGGVFREGVLTSVLTNGYNGGPAYGCLHSDLVAFIKDNASVIREGVPLVQCVDGKCPKDKNGRWIPSPNVPIKLPKDGTFPDRDSSKLIVDLLARVEALEKQVAELKKQAASDVPPPPGEKGPVGERGPKGDNATDAQVAAAVLKWVEANGDQWLDEHREHLRGPPGRDGSNGKDGKPGVVTVELFWKDAAKIATLPATVSGSKVKVPLIKTTSDPK